VSLKGAKELKVKGERKTGHQLTPRERIGKKGVFNPTLFDQLGKRGKGEASIHAYARRKGVKKENRGLQKAGKDHDCEGRMMVQGGMFV